MKAALLKKILPLLFVLTNLSGWAQPFNQKLFIPPLYTSPTNTFNITVAAGTHNFYPSQTPVTGVGSDTINYNVALPTMGYNGAGYLGPTMRWTTGQSLTVNQTNNLNMRTTIHWHGLNLPAHLDGGPQEPIGQNGGIFNATFTVIDPVQTVWYHSHLMDSTTYQVIKGLAGMIQLVQPGDALNAVMPHAYDTNDFPIILQDRGFTYGPKYKVSGTDSAYNVTGLDTAGGGNIHTPGNGANTLVNGVLNPYLKVPKGVVRFRFLNGSYRKAFQLAVGKKVGNATVFSSMALIATDGGYTAQPYAMDSLIIGPGERYEMLVDFSLANNKDTFYLYNRSSGLPLAGPPGTNGGPGTQIGYVTGGFNLPIGKTAFMAIIIDTSIHVVVPAPVIPLSLLPYSIDTSGAMYRTKVLGNVSGTGGNGTTWTIDGDTMDMMVINDTILVGRKEIWTIRNNTNVFHPFHIHKIQFQVIDIRDTLGNVLKSFYNNTLPKNMMGYKDDVFVPPFGELRFVTTFDHYGSDSFSVEEAFMYHCHILTHEDNSMMHQFIVLDSNTYFQITGINNPKPIGQSLILYPNPAGSVLNLKGSSTAAATLRITDMLGRTLHQENVLPFTGTTSIPVDMLPRGMVFVEWSSGSQHFTQKVLLK